MKEREPASRAFSPAKKNLETRDDRRLTLRKKREEEDQRRVGNFSLKKVKTKRKFTCELHKAAGTPSRKSRKPTQEAKIARMPKSLQEFSPYMTNNQSLVSVPVCLTHPSVSILRYPSFGIHPSIYWQATQQVGSLASRS